MLSSSQGTDGKVDDYLSKFVKYPEVTKTPTIEEGKAKEHVDGKNARINEGEMETCSKNKRTVPRYKILHRGQFDMQNFTLSRSVCHGVGKSFYCNVILHA